MLNVVVIGDLHLDGMNDDLGEEANSLIMAEVEKAEAWAVDNGVPEIWYPGDVCNRPVLSYDAHLKLRTTWRKRKLIRRVIPGNHDFREMGHHSLLLLDKLDIPNMHVYATPTQVEVGGIPVNFVPYPYGVEEPCELDPDDCINVGHFEVAGATLDNGHPGRGKRGVPKGTKWVLGHLHTPHDVGDVHYVGTLFQRNFGEKLPKSFTHLRARYRNNELEWKLDRVENDPDFKLITLEIESQKDLEQVNHNQLNRYKLVVSKSVTLTDTFMSSHPNVVRQDSYKTKLEKQLLTSDAIMSQVMTDEGWLDYQDYLRQYHSHLDKKQMKMADRVMTEIISELGGQHV